MKQYIIKVLMEDGTYAVADSTIYEAENELDALHQFAEVRSHDISVEEVRICNDDPDHFILFVAAWAEDYENMKFDVFGDSFEYMASEVKI